MTSGTGGQSDTFRVLHVDDEPGLADMVATFLEREDDRFEVDTAASASAGLDHLAATAFDCVISDYDMPGRNGIEFLEAVREEYPDLPFILYTGKGSEEIASDAISAGVTDYLQKVSGTDQYTVLANRLRNAIEGYRSRQALAERNRELRRYEQMVNSMHEAACIYDSEGRFELVNEYLADWYGKSCADLEGETSALIPQIRKQADGDPYRELLEGDRAEVQSELAGDFPGHGFAVLEYRLTPLRVNGTVEGVVGVARDITDRTDRQAELERKNRAMDAAPVGITISGPSQEDNPVIYVNDRFTEITGYAEEAVLGSNCRLLQGENTDPEQVAQLREAIDDDVPVTVELRNYRHDGTEFWNRVSIAPVHSDNGELTNYVGFQQDVTEEKERQEQLETSEQYRREIYQITADSETTADEKIQRLLALGCEFLDLENGHVVNIDRNTGRHEIRFAAGSDLVEVGTVTDLSETFCRRAIEADDILAIANASDDGYADDPAYKKWGISCYVGAKIIVDDELFGTLCFANRGGNTVLSGPEKAMVDLMARWISHTLERKQARRERERIFDRMTDGLIALNSEWYVQYANDRGRKLLGAMIDESEAPDELVGTHLWNAIPEAEATAFYEECQEAMHTQQQVSFQWYYGPLGRWFDVWAYPDEAGVSVYFQDVTEERQREDRIEAHKQTLQEIYDAIADTDQSFESRVDKLIEIGQSVTGTEYGSLSRVDGDEYMFEVVRAPGETIKAGDIVDLNATNCERAIYEKETLVLSDIAAEAPELMQKSGNVEWGVSCYVGSPVIVEGEVYGTFCFYDTESRREPFSEWEVAVVDLIGKWIGYELTWERTEDRLRTQNDRLEAFASIVSHDLRNPLHVANGRLKLVREQYDSEHLEATGRALSRMDELIEDLLTLAREGDRVREPESVDLRYLAETCWQNVATAGAELVVECDRSIRGDSSRVQQLFENLMRNAVEHGGEDVTITVGELNDGFFVEDDGPGIPEETRGDVFEAGYSTSQQGTGFGLAIVNQVVEAHDWNICVSNGPDGGARFEITGVTFTAE